MKKLLLIGTILIAAGCSPRRDLSCPSSTLSMCEPSIYFDYDSSDILDMNKNNIDWIAMKLNDWPGKIATLTGYADVRGTEEYNLALSGRRAAAVQEQLIIRGVDPNQIKIEAKGKNYPLTRKESEQDRNRRVDVTFAYPPNKFEATLQGWWDAMFGGDDEEPAPVVEEETAEVIEEAPAKVEEVKADAAVKVEAVKQNANNVKRDVKTDAKAVKADAQNNVIIIKNDVQKDVNNIKEDARKDVNNVQP